MKKLIIELEEAPKNTMYLHQEGFALSDDNGRICSWNTTEPGCFPYLYIEKGKLNGKIFHITAKKLQESITKFLEIYN